MMITRFYPKLLFSGRLIATSCQFSFRKNLENVPDVPTTTTKLSDPILSAVKAAMSTRELLTIVGIHGKIMEPSHITATMKALCAAHKNDRYSQYNIAATEEFRLLCKKLQKCMRLLETKQLLDALKAITLFKVPHNSSISQSLLYMIKNDINSMSIEEIMFTSFLLKQYPSDPMVDALKIAMPLVFSAQIKLKLDRKHVGTLVNALKYCSVHNVNDECFNYIVTALCELEQVEWLTMDPNRARIVLMALALRPEDSPARQQLFRDSVEIFTNNINTFSNNAIDVTLSKMSIASKYAPYFIHQPAFEAAAELAVARDFSLANCGYLLRKLNLVGVPSRSLLSHMANKILDDPEEFRSMGFGFTKTFVCGLSTANYRTDHWSVLKDLIPSCLCFNDVSAAEPWISFCLDLASLDIYCDKILTQVFSENYLEQFLNRDYIKLDLLQMLNLYHAVTILYPAYSGPLPPSYLLKQAMDIVGDNVVDYPLEGILAHTLGSKDYVLTHCFALPGLFIDHVIVLQTGGTALLLRDKVPGERGKLYETTLPSDSTRVAIRYLPASFFNAHKQPRAAALVAQSVLENLGYVVVNVAQNDFQSMPDWEKSPYLMQMIKLKCSKVYQNNESLLE